VSGGIVLTYEIDDAALLAALGRMETAGGDLSPTMKAIATHLETSTRMRFETESGPIGAKWAASQRATDEGGKTLTKSGDLRSSIKSAFTATTAEAGPEQSFGAAIYAAIHQFGFDKRRPVRAHKRQVTQAFGKQLSEAITVDVPAFTRHVKMPARPYVGWSEDDQRAAAEILTDHLKAAIVGGGVAA